MRAPSKCRATCMGTIVLWAQVRSGRSVDPNLRPARKRTLPARGNRATCCGSRRSEARAASRSWGSAATRSRAEKRGAARTRYRAPAAAPARRTRRASEGPIFPPAPRTRTSSVRVRAKATSAGEGRARSSSRWASSSTVGGSVSLMGPLDGYHENESGVTPLRGGITPRTCVGLERGPYADPEDPPRREPLHVGYRARAEHPGRPVVRVAVVQERREVGEVAPVVREELGMVERVVQERGELQTEGLAGNEVLVEGEVDDPGSRPAQAALLRVAVLAGAGDRVGGLIEELVA